MKTLNTYKTEISAISKANGNVGIGVATDMFLNNIKDANVEDDQYYYGGAGHLDYEALQPHYEELVKGKAAFLEDWGRELGFRK